MADGTKIEWTDATWNPITGCSVVSPGCTNCYAMKLAGTRLRNQPSRAGLTQETKAGPVWTGEVRFIEKTLLEPLKWSRPRMIFVVAHGDLFAEQVPDEWIDRIFAVMALCPQHVFQVLTKRPERMRAYLTTKLREHKIVEAQVELPDPAPETGRWPHLPMPHVWLGVSIEDQKRADERIPVLMQTPAALRWVSAEPLLGPVDLDCPDIDWMLLPEGNGIIGNKLAIDWVVAGGESGPGARPSHPDWFRSLRDQCAAAGIPFLFKQWGNWLGGRWEDLGDQGIFIAADREDHTLPYRRREDAEHWFEPRRWPDGPGAIRMHKAEAGRHLDGILHDGFPTFERNGR